MNLAIAFDILGVSKEYYLRNEIQPGVCYRNIQSCRMKERNREEKSSLASLSLRLTLSGVLD